VVRRDRLPLRKRVECQASRPRDPVVRKLLARYTAYLAFLLQRFGNYEIKKQVNKEITHNIQEEAKMLDLGAIQKEVMTQIRKASSKGDGYLLGLLGPVAAQMERMAQEWESLLKRSGSPVPNSNAPVPQAPIPQVVKFEGKRISGVTILGESTPVGSYKDALLAVARRLQAAHADFDSIAPTVRGRFPYFSQDKSDIRRKPEKLKNSRLFIETHNSADRQWKICTELVETFGHNPSDPSVLRFEVAPNRTRALKGSKRSKDDGDEEVEI
jgi:hypothetical protein